MLVTGAAAVRPSSRRCSRRSPTGSTTVSGVSALMAAPRMHHQHLPDALRLEKNGFDIADVAELQRLGHEVRFFERPDSGSIGATIERRDGRWYGQSDPRITGLAKGY